MRLKPHLIFKTAGNESNVYAIIGQFAIACDGKQCSIIL